MDTYIDWMGTCYAIFADRTAGHLGARAGSRRRDCRWASRSSGVIIAIADMLEIAYTFEQATRFARRHPADRRDIRVATKSRLFGRVEGSTR